MKWYKTKKWWAKRLKQITKIKFLSLFIENFISLNYSYTFTEEDWKWMAEFKIFCLGSIESNYQTKLGNYCSSNAIIHTFSFITNLTSIKSMDWGNSCLIKILKYTLFLRRWSFISKEYPKKVLIIIASSTILFDLFIEPSGVNLILHC